VPGTCRVRARPVTKVRAKTSEGFAEATVEDGGTPTPTPRGRRVLPRHDARQQQGSDRAGRLGSGGLHAHHAARRATVRLAHPRLLPDGQPLSPRPRDTQSKPLRRDAGPQRRLRTRLQRTAPPLRPRVRPALLVEADRIGGAVRRYGRIRDQQPGSPRVRPPGRAMALDVGARGPSDRFAWCRTTPTS
jgi:hypothetical protein